ncbi:hypothetical protein [Novosphingobium jiangmenense]|uniref:Uncharacterized protein n=1 Tax=Novosphingobium jiangmenense TaxID=2791981 RepID=A0ABS0HD66_9SPHN|nr:hypothetical protein [Novosphingobium jiangmenense]MBF9150202.1 hypothetical protein [Novosphingobium jiangmenense]
MSAPAAVASAKALRDDALAVFKGDLEIAKLEVSPGRVKERAMDEAVEMLDSARAIAEENKAVIGATLAALLGWFFREPIRELAERLIDKVRSGD